MDVGSMDVMERQVSTRTGEAQRALAIRDTIMPNRDNVKSETLGQRLRSLRGRQPRDMFAAALGIHKNTLARYETDERRPDAAFIRRVCHHCGVASDWLLSGDAANPVAAVDSDYSMPLPLNSVDAPPLLLHRDWIERERLVADTLMVATMAGDSMRPTLNDGDVLLVERDIREQRRDGVHVLELDGGLTVKRVQGLGGQAIQLLSDNTGYPPLRLSAAEVGDGGRCRVIGRVVWQFRRI